MTRRNWKYALYTDEEIDVDEVYIHEAYVVHYKRWWYRLPTSRRRVVKTERYFEPREPEDDGYETEEYTE